MRASCRVVGVTAPAGYGKSTLLAEWAGTEDRPVGWVSLARSDDDPAALLSLMASATDESSGNTDLIAGMGGLGLSVLGRAAPRLAAAFRASPEPFVLMLDDLHELQSPACHDALSVLDHRGPPGSQLVVASRSEQPHLARLRASGDALEFAASDLALDAAGAAQIFAQADLDISPETATTVTERTEGWPVGLYLAAVIARDGNNEQVTISGDDRYVADYLYGESLALLPESTQRFLRRTAVLDQLCAPLADALLGESGASEQLRRLEATSLFLVPLDRRREWFRYHALFREFLLAELRRVEPEAIPKLHLRAADWYESNGSPAMALEHLLNTSERDRCVQLVTELLLPTYSIGQMSTVQRWLAALGDSSIEAYPPLAVLAGWIAALTGQTAETRRWAAIVDAASFEAVPLDGSASFDSARAMLRVGHLRRRPGADDDRRELRGRCQNRPGAPGATRRSSCWPKRSSFWATSTKRSRCSRRRPRWPRSWATPTRSSTPNQSWRCSPWIAASGTKPPEHLDVALTTVDENRMDDYPTSRARLCRRGQARAAPRRSTGGGTAAHESDASPAVVLVRAAVARGAGAVAPGQGVHGLGRPVDRSAPPPRDRRHPAPRPGLGCPRRRGVASPRDGRPRDRRPERPERRRSVPAELRLLPYLQTHLTFREIGERLFVSRNTISSEVGSIYRKLGVSSRSDAVQQATAIGLLGA